MHVVTGVQECDARGVAQGAKAGTKTTTTTYIGSSVYQNDTLQFVGHEQGRTRLLNNIWIYDYLLKDHLGNTRMVLTDQQQRDAYPAATLETNILTQEQQYYQLPDAARVSRADVAGYPTEAGSSTDNAYIQRLRGDGVKVGSSILLRVMAGDKVHIKANSWYRNNSVPLSSLGNFKLSY